MSGLLLAQGRSVSGRATVRSRDGKVLDSSNVVVWLTPVSAPIPSPTPDKVYRLVQKNKQFIPHLLVVPLGASVAFPNQDAFFHNVFSVYQGTRFDLGLYESGDSKTVKFTRPGPSYIFCNIHPQMSAVILVLPTLYFAITRATGDFTISGVAPGTYEMKVWYERGQPAQLENLTRRVSVQGSDVLLDPVAISATPSLAEGHKNKFGKDYETAPEYKVP